MSTKALFAHHTLSCNDCGAAYQFIKPQSNFTILFQTLVYYLLKWYSLQTSLKRVFIDLYIVKKCLFLNVDFLPLVENFTNIRKHFLCRCLVKYSFINGIHNYACFLTIFYFNVNQVIMNFLKILLS